MALTECSECGKLSISAHTCPGCGASVTGPPVAPDGMICPACQGSVDATDQVCPRCLGPLGSGLFPPAQPNASP